MFREFIYLDLDRLQSILAQLQQGLMTDSTEGKEKSVGGQTDILSGFISQLFPMSGSIEGKVSFSASHNKILHDYAFALALDALRDSSLLLEDEEVTGLQREDGDLFPLPEAGFILVSGNAKLLDYALLSTIVEQLPVATELYVKLQPTLKQKAAPSQVIIDVPDKGLNRSERRRQERLVKEQKKGQGNPKGEEIPRASDGSSSDNANTQTDLIHYASEALSKASDLVRQILGDVIQFNLTTRHNVTYIGNLNRAFLREEIRSLIFKYGSNPQGEWKMLAQVSSIPEKGQAQKSWDEISDLMKSFNLKEIRSGSDVFNLILRCSNIFQEIISSVGYPDIAVAPIAIYREVTPLR